MPIARIPWLRQQSWYEREILTALVKQIPASLGAGIAFWGSSVKDKVEWVKWVFALLTVWSLGVLLLEIVRARKKDQRQDKQESPLDLLGCLHVIYRQICAKLEIPDDDSGRLRLRMTIHKVEDRTLEQCVAYVGFSNQHRGPGRRFSDTVGVIGQVARTGKTTIARREKEDQTEYIEHLVSTYGYSYTEAQQLMSDRKSQMGVPVVDEDQGHVIGVVYADSSDREFFDSSVVQELIINGTAGIAKFVHLRYAKV